MRAREKTLGFTLLELGIVLGVIAILGASMVPCLKSATQLPKMEMTVKALEENANAFRLLYAASIDGTWPGYDRECQPSDPSAIQTGRTPFDTPIIPSAILVYDGSGTGSGICTLQLVFHIPEEAINYISRFSSMTSCASTTTSHEFTYCHKLVAPPIDPIALHSANHP